MRKAGLTILPRMLLLGFACAMACCGVGAQSGSGGSRGDLELDLATYKAELDRCAESIRHGENIARLRESLPGTWVIHTNQARVVVSTDWLTSQLLQAEHDPAKSKVLLRGVQRHLAAMRGAATDLEGGSGKVNAESARPRLESILQRREFSRATGPSDAELLRARITRWIAERLLRLMSRLHIGRTAGNVVTWSIVALAFALLCYWVWQNVSRSLRNAAPSVLQGAGAANESRQWARDAFSAAERGDYREAVHCAYWATIVHLEGLGLLKRDHARTPRESLRLLDPHPKERQLLGDFTRHFELIWYGYRPASPEDWTNARMHLEKMGCLARSTPATANS
ncbi:MAG TPA: DUF4129 domain-containing protein [Candidatus Saccharimonadales bacterium]|jgi:hypothetical protein|nr:DUF4129 domain-containing protein [Candidatus Saccharimonadales bacterium]